MLYQIQQMVISIELPTKHYAFHNYILTTRMEIRCYIVWRPLQ
jgi:hypothetical protein